MLRPLLYTLLCLVLLALPPAMAAPSTIGYQGRLATSSGTPVSASLSITFRLYSAPSGGTALWTETQAGIDVDGGNFAVELGQITPLPASVWGQQLYLGVQVSGDSEMLPRPPLTAAPFALRAAGTMKRTLVVSAEGTPAQNGAALLAAVASITDASAASPVAVELDAGSFDLGTERLHLPEHTSLIGRGQSATLITSSVSTFTGTVASAATVLMRSNSTVRDLTARNTGVPADANDSVVGIGAFDPDVFQQPLVGIRLERVRGEAVVAPGSTGQHTGISLCAGNSRIVDVVGIAQGGEYAMALRADCPIIGLVIENAELYADQATLGLRGAYLMAGSGNVYKGLRTFINVPPTAISVYGLRFLFPGSFSAEPQGELADGLVSIRGDTSGAPVQAFQMDGISLEQDAQLARIERMQVKLTHGRAARVSGIRMRDRATNSSESTRLIDVDVAVSGISDSSVDGTAYGVQGLLIDGYPPELTRAAIRVDCLTDSHGPCVGIAQNYYAGWTPPPQAELLIDSSRIALAHAGLEDSGQTHSAALWLMGTSRIRAASLRLWSSGEETHAQVLSIHAPVNVDVSGSSLVATNAANTNTVCAFAGLAGATGEWYGNHLQGVRCDGGQMTLTCAGNTFRGTGFVASGCP